MNDGHQRASTRMPYWDYTQTALYFITICTHGREHTLGSIARGVFTASRAGRIVEDTWHQIPRHFPFVTLDRFRVMPNHIHGVIHITKSAVDSGGALHGVPLPDGSGVGSRDRLGGRQFGKMQKGSLSLVLNSFKSAVSRKCRMENIEFAWQDNFHDNIIRSDEEYYQICRYIENNVAQWEEDTFHTTH